MRQNARVFLRLLNVRDPAIDAMEADDKASVQDPSSVPDKYSRQNLELRSSIVSIEQPRCTSQNTRLLVWKVKHSVPSTAIVRLRKEHSWQYFP